MIPSPAELHYFVEIAGTLNISRAAERLGISQPSLSLAVKRLEDAIGVELLIRSKSGVSLTRAGQKFAVQARALLGDWDRLSGEALRAEAQLSGRYVIGCHSAVALFSLPQVVPALMRKHPDLELKLVHGLSRQITDDIIGHKIDFGIVVNPTQHPELVIKVLARDEFGLWIGPTDAAFAAAQAGDGILIYDPDLLQAQSMLKQMAKKGLTFKRTITSGSLELVTELTAAGAGVGLLPARVAGRDRKLGLRPMPLPASPKVQDKLCLVYRSDTQRSAASRMIVQALAKSLS